MILSTPSSHFGRHVFGLGALALGIVALVWHDYKAFDQLRYILNDSDGPIFVYTAAIAQITGGLGIQFRRTAKAGAAILGVVYLALTLLCVPRILTAPHIYVRWGNFFEQLSLFTGAGLVYACLPGAWLKEPINRLGRILFGVCAVSFALEQAMYLSETAALVPKWLPPNQTFWAVLTTVGFALAAVALLTNRMALLASRLLTSMIVSFGLIVWLPLLFSKIHSYANWSETAETFAIGGAAWVLADLVGKSPFLPIPRNA